MSHQTLLVARDGHVLTVTLNRPDRLNALNPTMFQELADLVATEAASTETRVLVLTGQGRGFCSGADVGQTRFAAERDNDGQPPPPRRGAELILALRRAPFVVLTAVNGAAAGAGLSLAVCGDVVLASEQARFTAAQVRIGFHPDMGLTYFLPRLIGEARARDLLLSGRTVDAETALAYGLVSAVVATDDFAQHVAHRAAELASGPPLAQRLIKQTMNDTWHRTLEESLDVEYRQAGICGLSEDFAEGRRAFKEHRAPQFVGR